MKDNYNILLVEDDSNLGYILKEYLQMNGLNVTLAKDGEEGLKIFRRKEFDLCLLDIMMPRKDGFTLAEEIKDSFPEQPIIFLTAKSLKIDKLKGFKLGADDFILKPVDEEELLARIKAVLNRVSGGNKQDDEQNVFQIGKYEFNFETQTLEFQQTKRTITGKEAEILRLLCQNEGKLVERSRTLKKLWGESDYFNRRSMDVFISKLRKYLSEDPGVKISNIHGKGFILTINH